MNDDDLLAREFELHRAHLRRVATRMLGSAAEADDAVQETWLRLHRSDPSAVENLGGWLTTVVSRVCLDVLRSRGARREDPTGRQPADLAVAGADDPEGEALLADAIGPALLVVLDRLTPAERVSFVLHDLFDVPFDDVAVILGRSPVAARQLASRARRRVRGTEVAGDDLGRRRAVVDAFLAAARAADFSGLLALLDPEVAVRADAAAVRLGAPEITIGPDAVAQTFSGRALGAEVALVDGEVAMVWSPDGVPKVAWLVTVEDGRVTAIDMVAEPDVLLAAVVTPGAE